MWTISKQSAVSSEQLDASGPRLVSHGLSLFSRRPLVICLLLTAYCLLPTGCRMDMQDQPKYKVYRASATFSDGLSSRPLIEGTIPRGYLREDTLYYTGKNTSGQTGAGAAGGATQRAGQPNQNSNQTTAPNVSGGPGAPTSGGQPTSSNVTGGSTQGGAVAASFDKADVTVFPFPITSEVLKRGQERYNIYCSVCHGMTGYGDGMIVRRGFRRPPSYHDDRLRQAPVGHFFDVITNGWGAMSDYSAQIPVQDRWAIIAYIRALQLSTQIKQNEVPPEKLSQAQPGAAASNGPHEGGGEQH